MANIITGDQDDNHLYGTWEDDFLRGLGGDDFLMGMGGNDTFEGGKGNDRLEDNGGNSTYLFGRGDGQDTILSHDYNPGKHNTIRFGEGIAPSDIVVERVNDDLVLRILGSTDSITVQFYFSNAGGANHVFKIEEIRFFDGASWDQRAIATMINPVIALDDGDNFFGGGSVDGKGGNDMLVGSSNADVMLGGDGNDRLHGNDGDDYLVGGAGDDYLDGGWGKNTFLFDQGWGHDTIVMMNSPSATNIEIAGTLPGMLEFGRSGDGQGNDLIITAKGAPDTITVAGFFDANNEYAAQSVRITFADHSVWDYEQIRQAFWSQPPVVKQTGTEGSDNLYPSGYERSDIDGAGGDDHIAGGYYDDKLDGGEGRDTLLGFDGNDLLIGGAGDDELRGDRGNDILLGGDGYDMLYGGDGDDVLDAGAGDARIDGGMGSNFILFGRNAGEYRIDPSWDGVNTIVLGSDVRPEDIVVSRFSSWEMSITIKGAMARLVLPMMPDLQGEGYPQNQTNAQLKFADATVWDNAILLRKLYTGDDDQNFISGSQYDDWMDGRGGDDRLDGQGGNDSMRGGSGVDFLNGNDGNDVLLGQDGDDHLFGGQGDDVLNGGAGDDFLFGEAGNNVFQIDLHGGIDTIQAWGYNGDQNVLQFGEGIAPDDVLVRIEPWGRQLTVSFNGSPDKVIVMNYVDDFSGALSLTEMRFANGVSWNRDDILRESTSGNDDDNVIEGTYGNDIMDGKGGNDILHGADGDDLLMGGSGNDMLLGGMGTNTLIGGTGDDILRGHADADTYIFNQGDGFDQVDDQSYGLPVTQPNVIRFGAGIAPASLQLNQSGATLYIYYGPGDVVAIQGFNADGPAAELPVNRFEFADGSTWTYRELVVGSHAPVLVTPVENIYIMEGQELDFTIAPSTFADLDAGDVLTYRLDMAEGGDLPSWLKFDALTGQLSGKPGFSDGGLMRLKVSASDQTGQTASDVFDLGVGDVDRPPELVNPVAAQNATEASAFRMVIPRDTFVDPDGSPLWYTLTLADLKDLPAWLTFDHTSLTLSGTPGHADTGTLKLWLFAYDQMGTSVRTEYQLAVENINQAPVLTQVIADQSATEASAFSITIPDGAFADADGDLLNYSMSLDGAPLPAWLAFDSATMTLSGTPGDADTGVLQLRLTATDGGGKAVSTEFALNVANVNQAPVLVQAPASQSVEDAVAFSYVLPEAMFSDVDAGDSGALSVQGLPSGFTFDAQTRTISGMASLAEVGAHALTVTFTDAGGLSAAAGFALTVTAAASMTLTGTSGANVLTGKSNGDLLRGLGGDDTLDGGIGADRMEGGSGNDTIYVDNAGDLVVENVGEGTDTVMASVSYTLGSNVERLTLTGSGAINATGNTTNNLITGNSGSNVIDGGLGDDSMVGGAGNDTYMVGSTSDVVTEAFGAGFDRVISSVGRTLGANQEALTLTGTASINGTGNVLNNLLQGNGAINSLLGGDGNDILQGAGGDDYLSDASVLGNLFDGGSGLDRLIGGAGNDMFVGGAGNDTITTGTGVDVIAFNRGDGIDAVAVTSGSDNTVSLGNGILYGDLALTKSGSDLILKTGMGEQMSFKGWYSSTTSRSVGTLQVVTEGTTEYVAGSASAIHDNKIEQFNFSALAAKFDQVRVGQSSSFSWSLASSLEQFSSGGSDTAAIGGDLAYQYATADSLAALSAMPALAIIGSPSFGASQTLQGASALNDGIAVLY